MKINNAFLKLLLAFIAIHTVVLFIMMEESSHVSSNSSYPGSRVAAETVTHLNRRKQNDAAVKEPSTASNVSAIFNACHPANNSQLVLFSVVTAPSNFEKRQKIRSTWGSVKRHRGVEILTAFFIGAVIDTALQKAIVLESRAHRDIIQDNSYIDTYRNLTSKTLSILRWANSCCPHALRVIKVDDDTLVNPYNVISFLHYASSSTANKLICFVTNGSKPYRNMGHKWYLSVDEYNGTVLPSYCQGYGYMIPSRAISKLLEASTRITALPLEDVYVTGILRESVGMLQLHLDKRLTTTCGEWIKPFLEKLLQRPKLLLMGHAKSLLQYDVFWQIVTEIRRPK